MLNASLAFFSLLLIRAMSYNLENSLYRVSSNHSIKSKLLVIKDIGHRSGLNNLGSFAVTRLKELGLVTTSFSREVRLHVSDDRSSGPPMLFNIIVRKVKNEIPYLGSAFPAYAYMNRSYLHMSLIDHPAVIRYMTRYGRKLSELTDNTAFITLDSRANNTLEYSLVISTGTGRYASAYKILKYLEQIVQGMHTLHRMANLTDDVIAAANSGSIVVNNISSVEDDIDALLGRV